MEKDKEELASLEAEEEAASAVDSEIDGVEAKIEQLTQTSDDTTSTEKKVRRQAATSCVEVGTLVDEMTKERETAKKLVLIRRITTSTILSCTSEDDKQFLVVAKTTLKEKIKAVKEANSENMNIIRQSILKVKVKIVTKEKQIENILAKLEAAIESQATTEIPASFSDNPTELSTQNPTNQMSTGRSETPIQSQPTTISSTNQPTTTGVSSTEGETPKPMTKKTTLKTEATVQPTTQRPTEETSRPTETPSTEGETPKPMKTESTSESTMETQSPDQENPTPMQTPEMTQSTPMPISATTQQTTQKESTIESIGTSPTISGETPLPLKTSTTIGSTTDTTETSSTSIQSTYNEETPRPMSTTGISQTTPETSSSPGTTQLMPTQLVGVVDVDFETPFVDIGFGVSPIEFGP